MAAVVDYCSAASTIGLDVIYSQRGQGLPEGDALFAEVVKDCGNVVVAALFDHLDPLPSWPRPRDAAGWTPAGTEDPGFRRFESVETPYPELAAAAAGIAHVNCESDADGVLRRYLVALRFQGWVVPSLAVELARLHWGLSRSDIAFTHDQLRIGARRFPLNDSAGMLLKFLVREAFTPQAFPIADILDAYRDELNGRPPRIPREAFQGKLVLIGSTTAGMYADQEATPTSGTNPGVVIHANALDNLLAGEAYRRPAWPVARMLLAGLVLVPGLLPMVRPLPATAVLAGMAFAYLAVAALAGRIGGWMIPVAAPLTGLALAGTVLGVRRWYGEQVRRSRLEQLEQAKQRFTDMLVHDLKGHASAIQMSLALLRRRLPVDDIRNLRLLQTAEAGGSRLLEQIYALLDIRRMQEGRLQLKRVDVDPVQILDSCREELAPAAELAGVGLVRQEPVSDGLRVSVDAEILSRVLGNLVWNAIQYAAAGSAIELGAVGDKAPWVELFVANQGRVIPAEQQQAVFDVFVSGALEDKQVKVPSTGLGLAFCKLAVEAHGGSILIESPWRNGGGVKVSVRLPAAA
jgi:signal transduction histidine kinase